MQKKTKQFEYSDTDMSELLTAVSCGETVRAFCRRKKIPHTTCFAWIHSRFPEQYAHAREAAADYWADEVINIAYDTSNDYKTNAKGEKVVDAEAIQRAKLKIDTIKWHVAKIAPEKYGDKLELKGKVDTNVTTNLPPEIAEMIASMKKGDEDNECSPVES